MNIEPETIVNEFGQSVRVYNWEDYQRRMNLRNPLQKETDLSGKRLVIKHTWGVGDVLYSTAALHGLKKKFPDCKITYISGYPDILENNPDVDQNIGWMDSPSFVALTETIKEHWFWLDYDVPLKGGYDYKLHLRTKPMLNEFLIKLLRSDVSKLAEDERAFVDQASSSVISRYRMIALDMYCAHACVEDTPEKSVWYYPYDHELEMAKRFFTPIRAKGMKVITLMPHSSTLYKDYPHWREVIQKCPSNYFWIIMDSFVRNDESWSAPNIFNASAAFKLRQAAALIIESDLNCSSDTGLLYPKAARGGKCVVTYGPHEPEPFLHYFPSAHGMRVPSVTGLIPDQECCSVGCYIDTTSCFQGGKHAPCLMQLKPEDVASKIVSLLEK